MSTALDVYDTRYRQPNTRANWLGRYLEVEKGYEKKLRNVLLEAERSVGKVLEDVATGTFSGRVRATQYRLAQTTIHNYTTQLFGSNIKGLISESQANAAEAAVNAALYDQTGLLSKMFRNPVDRLNYADSLRQTARRNVEATMTRVLETAQPLSQRVWKTRALANGLVDRAINNALARGDSADDLARAVRNLISPNVPGGVSYAAKRLGRTEINNAFHAQSINDAQEVPWITQMEWHLSKVHASDPGDLCESYALVKLFDVELVPDNPHPNCYCYVTSVLPDWDTVELGLVGGQYDSYLESVNPYLAEASKEPAALRAEPAQTTEIPIQLTKPLDIPGIERLNPIDTLATVDGVRNFLETKWDYHAIKNYNGLMVQGFTEENIALDSAKQVAHGIDDMLTKYPIANLLKVNVEDLLDRETYAETFTKGQSNAWHSTITHNKYWASDPDAMDIFMRQNVLDNFHPAGTDVQPFYWNTVHEFGHVLDDASNNIASEHAQQDVDALFDKKHKKAVDEIYRMFPDNVARIRERDLYEKWLKDNLPSRYSLSRGLTDYLNPVEATAEAFTDVQAHGYKDAKPLSRLLFDNLMKAVEDSKIVEGPRESQ